MPSGTSMLALSQDEDIFHNFCQQLRPNIHIPVKSATLNPDGLLQSLEVLPAALAVVSTTNLAP